MVQKILFIFEDINIKEFLKKNDLQNNILVICDKNEIKEKILKMNFNCKLINEYSLTIDQKIKALKWIKSWANKKIHDEKNIKELLEYESTSLYPYLESRLYHRRIQELVTLIEQIKNVFFHEKPEKVWLIGKNDLLHIVSYIHGNIEDSITSRQTEDLHTSEKSYSGFLIWKLLLLKIFRGIFLTDQEKKKKRKPILIITEVGSWRKTYNISKKIYEFQDVFFQNIMRKLKQKNEEIQIIDFENKPSRLFNSYSINKKRVKGFGCTVEPWEKFLSLKIILKNYSNHKKFKKLWLELKDSNKFKESLKVDNIPIYDLVKDDFQGLFNSFKALAAISMIDTAKKIVEQKSPSKIIMHDEYGALQYSFLNAAKKQLIPTLSIQHGEIGDNVFSYSHSNEDMNSKLNFLLPDKMCVWSSRAKNSLITSGNFPSKIIRITGDPKNDYLEYISEEFNRESILKKLNIPTNKKIIFFATENLTNIYESTLNAKAIGKAMSELKEFFLIIKIHPNETDISLYQKIIDELEISSYVILLDFDINKLIFVSDIVLINHSTVGLEAMRMLKPVISVNLMGLHDETTMINNNYVVEIRKSKELSSAILKNTLSKDERKMKTSKRFAEEILGKIDGHASDRIVNEILELSSANNARIEK